MFPVLYIAAAYLLRMAWKSAVICCICLRHRLALYAYSLYASILTSGRGAKYYDEYVCLSVCLSACMSARPNFTEFLRILPVALARFSPSEVAISICYVLPVLWMTS